VADTPAEVPREGEVGAVAAPAASAPVAAHAAETPWLVSLWSRIKEHKIVQWTVAYAAFAFVTLHAATLVGDALEWPHVIVRALTLILMLGLPMAPILAWYHGVRALKRVSIPELVLIVLLLVIAGALLWRSPHPTTEQARTETATQAVTEPVKPASAEPVFAPPAHSIAVLPFVNMSGDPKQEYFSDGISEELLNSLSRLNDLQVVARTSSFSFKGKDVDVSTIAHQLNVGAVLEGSVRRAGNTVRITVQLINAVSGFHMWSQTYDRNLTDVLKVQTEVATAVAQQLEAKLSGNETQQIELGGTKNPEAYDAYLRGLQLVSEGGDFEEGKLRAALEAFDQAIHLDPDYAWAYIGRARALNNISAASIAKPGERANVREQALKAGAQAVALAPELGEAHLVVASTHAYSLDLAGAAPEYERALRLAPGSAFVQSDFAWFSTALGHFDSALQAAHRAVALDPQDVRTHTGLGVTLLFARRYDEALVAFHDARLLDPGSHWVGFNTVQILLASGQPERARQDCESPSTPLDEDHRHYCLTLAYHALGRQTDAERELGLLMGLDGDRGAFWYFNFYALSGNKAAALQWLSRAEKLRDPRLQLLRVLPGLEPIRQEPQFKAIEARLNFPP
jgi:adenylate cyclase